jgi:hypothetical protein
MKTLAALFIGACMFAQATEDEFSITAMPKGSPSSLNPVRFTLQGRRFEKTEVNASAVLPEPVRLLHGMYVAYRSDKPEDVVAMWIPAERERVAKLTSNNAFWSGSKGYFGLMKKADLLYHIRYGQYEVLLVRENAKSKNIVAYTFEKTPEGYRLSNALKEDPFYTFLMMRTAAEEAQNSGENAQ